MKLITELNDDVLFMQKAYEVASTVAECLKETQILEIRKRKPVFTGTETPAERKAKFDEQAKKNLMDMAKKLMVENPKAAITLFQSMVILEEVDVPVEFEGDGTPVRCEKQMEEYPKGIALLGLAIKCISSPEVINFFTFLIQLGQSISAV